MTTVYIDESGHSGDMINSGNAYDFSRASPTLPWPALVLRTVMTGTIASMSCEAVTAFLPANSSLSR